MRRLSGALIASIVATVVAQFAFAADIPTKAPVSAAAAPASGSFWAEGEYLYWKTKGDALPALITTGAPAGLLGAPGTSVLFGQSTVMEDWRSGVRVRAGYWLDPRRTTGIEAHAFGLENASAGFAAASDGSLLLARPFFDPVSNLPRVLLIAGLGFPGQVSASVTSRLLGAGVGYRSEFCSACAFGSVSGYIGYRYLRLKDDLAISSLLQIPQVPLTSAVTDQFETRNNFHGLDLGLSGRMGTGPWQFEWQAKVALGATLADIAVNGLTTTTVGGVTTVAPGGLLALQSNMGNFHDRHWSVAPELDARIIYQFSPQLRASVGYSFVYWTDVVRTGGVIDTVVNPTLIPPVVAPAGPARPAPRADTTDFWAHGVTAGLRYNF